MKRRMLSILLALAFLVAGVPAADVAVTEAAQALLEKADRVAALKLAVATQKMGN